MEGYEIHEYEHNGCIIAVYRPILTEEERKNREAAVVRALANYGEAERRKMQNV